MKALINELLLDDFPELIVLKVHGSSSLNHHLKRFHSVAIERGHLLLNHRNDDVPEIGRFLKLLTGNVAETVCDLLRSHDILTETLVHIDDVGRVPGVHEHEVDLMESHSDIIVVVVIATSVNLTEGNWGQLADPSLRLHEAETRLLGEKGATPGSKSISTMLLKPVDFGLT